MTRQEERFYCVSCGELVTSPKTDIMFRTGFFKIVHPMCYCLACSHEEEKYIKENGLSVADNNYDYKMLLKADAKVAECSNEPYHT